MILNHKLENLGTMVLSPVYYRAKKKNNPKEYLKLKNLAKVEKAKKILKLNSEKDFQVAKRLLEEAQDYHEAKVGLAIIYFRGYGYIKTDHLKSKNLLMKAYEQGNKKAFLFLFYYFGHNQEVGQELDLVEEDLIKFKIRIQEHSESGNPIAKEALKKMDNYFEDKKKEKNFILKI